MRLGLGCHEGAHLVRGGVRGRVRVRVRVIGLGLGVRVEVRVRVPRGRAPRR